MQAPKKTTTLREALRNKAGLAVETPTAVPIDEAAVAEGRKPLPTRRQDVATLRTKIKELYGIPATGGAALLSIDALFKFSPVDSDAEFNYLQVEPLLEHARVLLERCASYRLRSDQLQAEKWKLQLELDRFLRLDQIAGQERETGAATLGYERAVLESAAEQRQEEHHKSAEMQLKDLTNDLVGSGLTKRMAARELAAWLSAYPLKDGDLRGDDAAYTFDGVRKTKPEHLYDAARKEADEDAWEQIYSLMFQRYSAMAQSEGARLRKQSLELQAKASLAAIALQREKDQAVRDAVWEKIYQVQSSGGVLNYHERIQLLERDFSTDFREGVACLTAARRGLSELYDYAPAFPQEGMPGYFDSVVAWVRSASTRMAQFSRLEQNYVLAVSLKELTKSQWDAGRTSGQWTFDLPEEMFAGQVQVRLRGLGVSVVGQNPETQEQAKQKAAPPEGTEGFWTARVSLPATGTMRNASGASRELDQKSLPVCFLGCVTARDAARGAEIAGARALHNASPIGKQWKLTLSHKSTSGSATETLQDVELFLHLAVRGGS